MSTCRYHKGHQRPHIPWYDLPSERLVVKMPHIFMRFDKLLGGDAAETLIAFQSD